MRGTPVALRPDRRPAEGPAGQAPAGAAPRNVASIRSPARGQDRLRMELHALDGQLAVADAHQHAAAAGGHHEAVRQPLLGDHERVVAADDEVLRQPGEDARAVVGDRRRLAVHRARGGRPRRRTPGRATGGRGTRRASARRPRGSAASPRRTCPPRPACTARARRRPGRARRSSSSSTVAASLRTTSSSAPSSPSPCTRL